MLINNFALPDSRCSKSYSTEELHVCDSESVETLSDERGKGSGKEDGKERGKTAVAALAATGGHEYTTWVHRNSSTVGKLSRVRPISRVQTLERLI